MAITMRSSPIPGDMSVDESSIGHNNATSAHVKHIAAAVAYHRPMYSGSPVPEMSPAILTADYDARRSAKRPPSAEEEEEKTFVKTYFADLPTSANTLVYLLCLAFAAYQVHDITKAYGQYETTLSVEVEEPLTIDAALPGITVCNKNQIHMDPAIRKFPSIGAELLKAKEATSSGTEAEKRKAKIAVLEKMMPEYYKIYTMKNQLEDGPNKETFLRFVACNDKPFPSSDYKCNQIRKVQTAQGKGNCITLFHEGAIKMWSKEVYQKVPSDLYLLNKTLNTFVPQEMVKLVVNFEPDSYTDLGISPGAEIMFHDRATIPLEASYSITMRPGKYYQFYLKKTVTYSMESPYTSMCKNYTRENFDKHYGKKEVNKVLQYPLSETQCKENCIIDKVIHKKKCWPKEIPYWANNSYDSPEGYSWCHKVYKGKKDILPEDRKKAEADAYRLYSEARKVCIKECPTDCRSSYFEIFYQEIEWPSEAEILTEKDEQKRTDMKKLKANYGFASVRYTTMTVSVNRLSERLTFANYLAGVGGIVSWWIGICIVSTYDLMDSVVTYFFKRFRR